MELERLLEMTNWGNPDAWDYMAVALAARPVVAHLGVMQA
jgi:hypothetical protein